MDTIIDEPLASPLSKASTTTIPPTPSNHRKERGAIAAQACDTCRSRKQRCDEQRPKCGTCLKFKLECNYREPQPTKKDRTLIEILDSIKRLENKLDNLHVQQHQHLPHQQQKDSHQQHQQHHHQQHQQHQQQIDHADRRWSFIHTPNGSGAPGSLTGPGVMSPRALEPMVTSGIKPPASLRHNSSSEENLYAYAASCAQMMSWPVFQHLLGSIKDKIPSLDPSKVESEMSEMVLGLHSRYRKETLSADGSQGQLRTIGPGISSHTPGGIPLTIADLNWEQMQRLSKAYFDSWNFMFPLLDRHTFHSETLPTIMRDGFNDSITSTLVLLVFALGEQALAGYQGIPISTHDGRPSGIKGGTAKEPPGLVLFNEARRRLGFTVAECSLENAQMFAVMSLYYGACSHTMELWRLNTCASRAVIMLIHCKPSELSSPRGDIIRRVFWHCSMMETCMHLELGLPLSGLDTMEKDIGMPIFSGTFTQEDYVGNQATHFQEHFASQIVLRRLMSDFNQTLGRPLPASPPSIHSANQNSRRSVSSERSNSNTNPGTIHHLAAQLDQWRGMLPLPLRWDEESPGCFPNPSPGNEVFGEAEGFPRVSAQPLTPAPVLPTPTPSATPSAGQGPPPSPPLMFTTDLDTPPVSYPYALDIQVALLRTRYYYNKYILYRPFIYKALHHPDAVTAEDAQGVAICLRAALKWPVTMSPTCARKRLIPCLFIWTQNVLGVLLLLHLTRTAPILQRIVGGFCGDTWEMDASETVGLYVEWLRDLREIDGAAAWGWDVVRAVYGLE